MNRRQLLVTSGTGLATALSGCSALSGGSDDESDGADDDSTSGSDGESGSTETETATDMPAGPASFEEVSLAAADGAQIGSELTLTVSATNVGGETGTFEGTVRLAASGSEEDGGPSFSQSVSIESVAPGETGETEVAGPTFDTVDDYEFVVADTDAAVTVRPDPETGAVGETLAVGEDLAVTVDDVSVQESVFVPSYRSSGLSTYEEVSTFGAPSGHVLAVVTVTAENTGTATASAERGTIDIADAEWYGDGEGAPGSILGRSGERFTAGGLPEIAPSESATGYFVAQVPRDTARGTIEITGQADATGTLPERVWTAEPSGGERGLPELTLESVDVPEATQLGRDYEITATVANEGDATGTLRGVVQWEDDTAWAQLSVATSHAELDTERPTGGVVRREVDPGVSTEITLTSFTTVNGQYTYRFQPFGDEWQVDFQEAMLAFGDRLKYDSNANIVVEDLRVQDTVTAYDDFDGEEFESEPDDGNQYVAIQLRFEKRDETEDYASTPDTGNFWLTAGGNSVSDSTYIGDEIREDWYEPIEGDLENQPEITGWLFMEAPAEYAAAEFAVRFEEGGGFGSDVSTVATWEQ